MRLIVLTAALSLSAAAQTLPSFEAASIRVQTPEQMFGGRGGAGGRGMLARGAKFDASRLTISSMPLHDIIASAYRLKPYQLEAPDWSRTLLVDINAKLPAGETEDHIPEMMQSLLAERFGLKIHRATKEQPVYSLTATKGLKLKDAPPDDPDTPVVKKDAKAPDFGLMGRLGDAKMTGDPMTGMKMTMSDGQVMKMSLNGSGLHIDSSKSNMAQLTEIVSMFMDLPVVDNTGLTGNYQVGLDVSMEDMMTMMQRQGFGGMGGGDMGGGPGRGGPGGPMPPGGIQMPEGSGGSILTSVQKLGLKLDKTKAPAEFVIVDRLEKQPTDN